MAMKKFTSLTLPEDLAVRLDAAQEAGASRPEIIRMGLDGWDLRESLPESVRRIFREEVGPLVRAIFREEVEAAVGPLVRALAAQRGVMPAACAGNAEDG